MMNYRSSFAPLGALALSFLAASCGGGSGDDGDAGLRDATVNPITEAGFFCFEATSKACIGNDWYTCTNDGEFLRPVIEHCAEMNRMCVNGVGCLVCHPNEIGCVDGNAVRCNAMGTAWDIVEECDINRGVACIEGSCQNLCDRAVRERSYVGCEFYAADLDNAGIGPGQDASAQQYSVVVSNTSPYRTQVIVERNDAAYGEPVMPVQVASVEVLPGQLEVFNLERREVDGSSSNRDCEMTSECPTGETCLTIDMRTGRKACRNRTGTNGINDGTHTAVTSNAYRIRSVLPIIAYQFNPLDNVGVFSNDASLLLPTSAIDSRYTIVAWPQTIANSRNPDQDFDPSSTNEDLRAFLTILGTSEATHVSVRLSDSVFKMVGGGPIPALGPNGTFDLDIGPFDVINLETEGFNADFTGSVVTASHPVTVFVGSEASDAPRFDRIADRLCCADHLEEAAFPDSTLGTRFIIGRDAPRTLELNQSFVDPRDHVAEPNEPEWVRVVAAATDDNTTITTSLPAPNDVITLMPRASAIFRADQDFVMNSDRPIGVILVSPSQEAVGIPSNYPGGDPDIVAIPPVEQYRDKYVFLTPELYAFDNITIMADAGTNIALDGRPLPSTCTVSPADGIQRLPGDPPPEQVVYRCQLSFPEVSVDGRRVRIDPGDQNDGVHTLVADHPVGLLISGWDAFVSYAYSAGLNLRTIN